MRLAKAMHAPGAHVLDLDRQVRAAHERLPEQVDAVTDVRRRRHHWQAAVLLKTGLRVELLARGSHVVHGPVALAEAVLDQVWRR